MFLGKKMKNTQNPQGGGGLLIWKFSNLKNVFFTKTTKHSAFSLIELSIVLIIMGLLVAGITNGASMIENVKITSLKREVDDHIRDVFTFYSRTGRLPGDLDNSGQIGWASNRNAYSTGSFSTPYSMANINKVCGPFIELYLYGISSFKPDYTKNGITFVNPNINNLKNEVALKGGIPISKVYKDIIFTHRTENTINNGDFALYGVEIGTKAINMFLPFDKKTVNIAKKIDLKFDDGTYNDGNIRGFCNNGLKTPYSSADYCEELIFHFGIK
jgi:prepilin-type N-terminal cleavage/methylation domain-containing protein